MKNCLKILVPPTCTVCFGGCKISFLQLSSGHLFVNTSHMKFSSENLENYQTLPFHSWLECEFMVTLSGWFDNFWLSSFNLFAFCIGLDNGIWTSEWLIAQSCRNRSGLHISLQKISHEMNTAAQSLSISHQSNQSKCRDHMHTCLKVIQSTFQKRLYDKAARIFH